MLNTADPDDLVEDPRPASLEDDVIMRPKDDGTTPPGLGSSINRRENHVTESDGASDEDIDLENQFLQEMDTVFCDSDSDRGSDNDECVEKLFGSESCERKVGKIGNLEWPESGHDSSHTKDACATMEWSQFMSSAEGVFRYMKKATAEVLDASGLETPSMRGEKMPHGDDMVGASENENENIALPIGALFRTSTISSCSESRNLLPAVCPHLSHISIDLAALDRFGADASQLDQHGSNELKLLASVDEFTTSDRLVAAVRQPVIAPVAFLGERSLTSDGGGDVEHVGSVDKQLRTPQVSHSSSVSMSPGRQQFPVPDSGISTAVANKMYAPSVSIPVAPSLASTTSRESAMGGSAVHKKPLDLIGAKNESSASVVGFALESPNHLAEVEVNWIPSRQRVEDGSRELETDCVCTEGEISAVAKLGSQVDVIASVGEAEVARRVTRGKTRSIDAKRQRREENVKRSNTERAVTAFQAIWRGSCSRAQTAPAIADHRQEAQEQRRMLQEERLAEHVIALEAQRREQESQRQLEESHSMRCEEKRTHEAWVYLRRIATAVRGEELVRMRAEERFTRALLDLERQDLQRVEMAHREEEESVKMRLEDLAMREHKRVADAQIVERASMGVEDVRARASKNLEDQQLSISRAEACQMAVEDNSSSAWNAELSSQLRRRIRQAWGRSTPIQRLMDPKGVAAARALAYAPSQEFCRHIPFVAGPESQFESERSVTHAAENMLAMERARRKECCKHHLRSVYADALRARRDYYRVATAAKKQENTVLGLSNTRDVCSSSQDKASLQEGHILPIKGRAGPAERDGAERELTVDMLSHLGPMKDLTELDLCVEGLTSAPLLRVCTSLKSLSLNVNRLSSPAGLVESTSLVRLGLRDNRLSSLQGLSGLPCLRELRLDINHLTSLHELKRLPALVELSANTNHIQELPEGFAVGLMSADDPFQDRMQSAPTLVERVVACGGLQKLELYHNRITSIHPKALQGLDSLTHLDLGRNQLRTLSGQGLESCPALSTLILSQNQLREPPFPICLPLLNELWLSGNQISTMGAWAVWSSSKVFRCPSSRRDSERGKLPGSLDSNHAVPRKRESRRRGSVTSCGLANDSEREEHDAMLAAEENGNRADNASVWLPSLEVLHLQDNALETLGGCSSLAGCPFLRSIDASFNQLRTPHEVGVSLQACSELEEVRLHDNPASSCQNYADAIALSCLNLKRMDGVLIDSQAHWRAELNTYGGRADLVLPFLLSTDDATGIHGGESSVTAPSHYAPDEPIGERFSDLTISSKESIIELCPWCGAARPRIENAHDTVNYAKLEGRTVGGGASGGDDAQELNHPLRHRRLPQHTQDCVREDMSLGRSACASCSFTFPHKELWSVPESTSASSSVKWEDVCSAGDRWNGNVFVRSSVGDTDKSDTFRTACLRGRDEHARLKREHRRDERELAALTVLNGEEFRLLNGGADRMSRLAPVAPSKRVLDRELDLGERHSKELRDFAARQLRFHGDGIYQRDADCFDTTCVILDATPDTMKRDQHEGGCLHDGGSKESRGVLPSPAHGHEWAAVVIQRLWQRRRDRAAPLAASPPAQSKGSRPRWPMREQAVTKLQSAFRGFHVRRALQAALESARYVDEELEGLLNMDGGARFELDRFLSPPPELRDGWWRDSSTCEPEHIGSVPRNPTPPSRDRALGDGVIDTAAAVFNSIHLRSESAGAYVTHVSGKIDVDLVGHGVELHGVGGTDQGGRKPRTEADGKTSDKNAGGINDLTIRADGRDGGYGRGAGVDLARAWGLKDPSVVRSMVKRAKRLRMFQTSEARREKLKDPTVRFEAFVRNACEREGESIDSSRSGGGGGLGTHRSKGNGGHPGKGSRASGALVANTSPSYERRVWSKTAHDNAVVPSPSGAQHIASGLVQPYPPMGATRRTRRGGSSLLVPPSHNACATISARNLGAGVFFEKSSPRLASERQQAGLG